MKYYYKIFYKPSLHCEEQEPIQNRYKHDNFPNSGNILTQFEQQEETKLHRYT